MTPQEKQELGLSIRKLTPVQLQGIIDIMKDTCNDQGETLEFDIDTLPPRKCRELERYVHMCLRRKERSGEHSAGQDEAGRYETIKRTGRQRERAAGSNGRVEYSESESLGHEDEEETTKAAATGGAKKGEEGPGKGGVEK